LYGLFVCLLLATPTVLATNAASTAQAAKTGAQMQSLSAVSFQIQALLSSMRNDCSGGSNGLPPNNWGDWQSRGNKAVNALNIAKLALAERNTIEAAQQITSAQAELNTIIDGVALDCPGGGHGVPPNSYSNYLKTRAQIQGGLSDLAACRLWMAPALQGVN
jgi:hypothetical protein